MPDGSPVVIGTSDTANAGTTLVRNGVAQNTALTITNQNGHGIRGQGQGLGVGVRGDSSWFYGVYASTSSGIALGAFASGGGHGVWGESTSGVGIHGHSTSNVGVRGDSDTAPGMFGSASNATGVRGSSTNRTGVFGNTMAGAAGVAGLAPNGIGVGGQSNNHVGVAGFSDSFIGTFGEAQPQGLTERPPLTIGVLGRSHPANGRGVIGFSNDGFGVGGVTTTGWAGRFDGRVGIVGSFIVFGGSKSAALAHPDGSYRLTYTVESPESWLEDVGRAALERGHAVVELDPDFAALVRTDDYHVFLTPEGECNGLFVARRGDRAFDVHELNGGTSDVEFSYRVVARRADVEAARLAPIDLPPPIVDGDLHVMRPPLDEGGDPPAPRLPRHPDDEGD
jgi:hypothetical protein